MKIIDHLTELRSKYMQAKSNPLASPYEVRFAYQDYIDALSAHDEALMKVAKAADAMERDLTDVMQARLAGTPRKTLSVDAYCGLVKSLDKLREISPQ